MVMKSVFSPCTPKGMMRGCSLGRVYTKFSIPLAYVGALWLMFALELIDGDVCASSIIQVWLWSSLLAPF